MDIVSIHAPARGATDCMSPRRNDIQFQSTRPHGARPVIHFANCPYSCFNPRARTGRDNKTIYRINQLEFQSTRPHGARQGDNIRRKIYGVSIHAPARGATWVLKKKHLFLCFNPRARTGRDVQKMVNPHGYMFQSTRPHGARQSLPFAVISPSVSIHAPARGATQIYIFRHRN